jgi:hypothetical protein
MINGEDVPAPGNPRAYAADEIILYGIKLNMGRNHGALDLTQPYGWHQPFEILTLRLELFRRVMPQPLLPGEPAFPPGPDLPLPPSSVTIATVYGYAFEGHCFRTDKARVMAFYYDGPDLRAEGCGFDQDGPFTPQSYRMWRIKAKTPMVEMNVSVDFAETLVLEANLPGKRAPNTYDSRMQLAHRGGRITGQ